MFGEEIFAAGAILSGDAPTAATLRMSDIAKILILGLMAIGNIMLWVSGEDIMKTLLSW
jgi:hypothetical protein